MIEDMTLAQRAPSPLRMPPPSSDTTAMGVGDQSIQGGGSLRDLSPEIPHNQSGQHGSERLLLDEVRYPVGSTVPFLAKPTESPPGRLKRDGRRLLCGLKCITTRTEATLHHLPKCR
jgi:hypothetical protein